MSKPSKDKQIRDLKKEVKELKSILRFYATKDNYEQSEYWAYPDGSAPSMFDHDPEGLVPHSDDSDVQKDQGTKARAVLRKRKECRSRES